MSSNAVVPYDVAEAIKQSNLRPLARWQARRAFKSGSFNDSGTFVEHKYSLVAGGNKAITAAGQQVKLGDRAEARRYRAIRQGWQEDAWAYHDAVPEVGFAYQFLANCMMRLTAYPAVYPANDPQADPIPVFEDPSIRPEDAALCQQIVDNFAQTRAEMSAILESASTNLGVTGEGWVLGMVNAQTGIQEWSIRSIDEVIVKDDIWQLREVPNDPQATIGWVPIEKETSYLARIWIPHPRFKILANSPMRRLLDTCEELLMLNRGIRAVARSRLAGAGILKVPENLRVWSADEDNDDAMSDPLIQRLATAMMTPISDEGVASAVVPLIVSGEAEGLAAMQHMLFERTLDPIQMAQRVELRHVLAVGLDLPAEVITGAADLNHWSLFQVDDNTFREHVEPHIIRVFNAITVAYYRNALLAKGMDPAIVRRMCMWYNATDLVTHPDRAAAAVQLYNLKEISGEALRRVSGFSEADKPSPLELELRMAANQRTLPPNLLIALFHALDPELRIPAITAAGVIPGIGPAGLTLPPVPAAPSAAGPGPTPPPTPTDDVLPTTDSAHPMLPTTSNPLTASAARVAQFRQRAMLATVHALSATATRVDDSRRLSRRLVEIDRDLRTQLQVSANALMVKKLSAAGARLRSRVPKDETERLREIPNTRLAAALGAQRVARLGITPTELAGGWDELKTQWHQWVPAAQRNALATALQLASVATDDEAATAASTKLAAGVDVGWHFLESALESWTSHLLYNPAAGADAAKPWGDLDPNQLVPTGLIRASVAVAGGAEPSTFVQMDGYAAPFQTGAPVGEIGTGATLSDLLTNSDAVSQQGYEWAHGPSMNPYQPHLDLDGVQFDAFDDPQLANNDGFPDNAYFLPGDHPGCMCDFVPLWLSNDSGSDTTDSTGDTGDVSDGGEGE